MLALLGALIALRFLQGMAGAVGVVLSLAMVRDLYHGAFGMMRPNATAVALANQGSIAGTASAWLGRTGRPAGHHQAKAACRSSPFLRPAAPLGPNSGLAGW